MNSKVSSSGGHSFRARSAVVSLADCGSLSGRHGRHPSASRGEFVGRFVGGVEGDDCREYFLY